jgi:cell division septation protein DedD
MTFQFVCTALSILGSSGVPNTGVPNDCLVNGVAQNAAVMAPAAQAAPMPQAVPMSQAAPMPAAAAAGPTAAIRAVPLMAEAPPAPVPAVAPKAMAAPAPAPAAAAGAGHWSIHLASYLSARRADQGWSELRHALPAVLGALSPSKVTVTFKGKGTFVRLLAGPFDDLAAAEKACAALSAAHQYCHPLAPGRERL